LGTVKAFDAAYCPNPVPGGYTFAEVYIGGSSAYHIWTNAELERVRGLPVLPIWVPTPGSDNPSQIAQGCAARMAALGLPPGAHRYHAVMLDMEASTNAAFVAAFAKRLLSLQYDTYVYGSADTVFSLPQCNGYVVADPTGAEHLYARQGKTIVGTQYNWDVTVPGGLIDENQYQDIILDHLSPLSI
jgi:hypothetical protein